MADEDVQYEFKSVKAIRGAEARSIAKWEKSGWELDTQTPGTLRTDLTFRRVKKQLPKAVLAGVIGFFALVIIGGIVAGIVSGGDSSKRTAAPTTVSPSFAPSKTPSKPASRTPSATSQSAAETTLTAENNPEFAALLAEKDSCDDMNAGFANKYEGRIIEYEGSVANLTNHGDYDTRYDILTSPGNRGSESTIGPSLKFENVNISDLNLTGADSVSVDDKLHILAQIEDYNSDQCLFFLRPVSTKAK